jgi:RNA-directed DNA polymerase
MSGESDRTVPATSLVIVAPDKLPLASTEERARAKAARDARAQERAKASIRWKAIVEAGGSEAWVQAELRQKGLAVDTDPASLLEGDKAAFKERKKAEAQERRALIKLARQAYLATHVDYVGAGIFYRDDDDETSREKEARLARAKANDLAELESPSALVEALGLDAPTLRWMCFHREVEATSHYQFWTIPKRDGTSRLITAPKRDLKRVQRWLLRNVVEKLPVHGAAHGFLRARSIGTNAAIHAGADVVVKIDVKDFFPTITFRRVKGLFVKGGLPESVATLCALLATESPREVVQFRGKTLYVAKGARACPQGAPTSPAITNAICLRLDRRLSGLARVLGYGYSRYADDLAFSWRKPPAEAPSPETRAESSRAPAPVGTLLRGVATILRAEGFRVHQKKTAVRRAGSSQRITGLVVNKTPIHPGANPGAPDVPPARVPRETIRRLRAAIHNREQGKPGKEGESLHQLHGMAAFIFMVDPKKGRAFLDRIAALEKRASSAPA